MRTSILTILLAAAILAQKQPAPVFRSSADVVEVDAIVADREGRFVRDLRLDEIEVLEDGRPQRVQSFYLVENGAAVDAAASRSGADAALPATRPPRRAFLLLFDREHLAPGSFKRMRDGADAFLRTELRDGDLAGVVGAGFPGAVRLNSSREDALAAVGRLKPSSDLASRLADLREWPRIINEVEAIRIERGDDAVLKQAVFRACDPNLGGERGPYCGEQAEAELRFKGREFVRQTRAAAERTLKALAAAAAGLGGLDGRKTLVLATDGVFADEYTAQLRQIAAAAGRAGVTIYAIDARGLDRGGEAGRSIHDQSPPDSNLAGAGFDTRDDPADQLTADTGGLVVRNMNDGAKALAAVARDTSTYYVIGYAPHDTKWDGRFRRIEVKVRREGVIVRARRGYSGRPVSGPLATGPRPPGSDLLASGLRPPASDLPASPSPLEPLPASSVALPSAELAPSRPNAAARVRELMEEVVAGAAGAPGAAGATELRAVPSSPGNEAAARGWARYERGDLKGAARELAVAVGDARAPVWAHYALGQAQFGLRRFSDAVREWERVRTDVPDFEPVYFDLVDGYLQLDRARDAIAVLRDAARRWPRDPEVFNALGVVQVGRGALDDAADSFRKAIAADAQDALAYFNLGRVLEMRYLRSRHWVATTASWVANHDDRRNAIANYQRYLELGGPFEQSAREGLSRLEWK